MAGGCGCHTSDDGPVGAGGREIKTPFGVFYGTNITPDPDTGIGSGATRRSSPRFAPATRATRASRRR